MAVLPNAPYPKLLLSFTVFFLFGAYFFTTTKMSNPTSFPIFVQDVRAQSADAFRVMTFNTEEEEEELQERATKEFAINVLNENVKILNLQEAEATAAKADAIQSELRSRGRSEQVYFVSDRYMNNEDEMGIITLFPMEGTRQDRGSGRAIRISDPVKLEYGNGWRTYLTVRLQTPNGPLRVFNVHPGFLNEMGGECVEGDDNIPQFIQANRRSDEMVIVAGDFNANLRTLGVGDCGEWIDPNYIRTCTIQSNPMSVDQNCPASWNESNGKRGTIDHILIARNTALRMLDYKVPHEQKWNFSDHWPVFATLDFGGSASNSPPDNQAPNTPSLPPVVPQIQSAPDGTLPWSLNSGQGVVGPTAAWSSQATNTTAICNGVWCWIFDLVQLGWRGNGVPVNVSSQWGSNVQARSGLLPWSNGAPTAGWENYRYKLLSIANTSLLWLYKHDSQSWEANGYPFYLPDNNPWNTMAPAPDGTVLLSGKGITTAWTDIPNSREYFCQGKWCWVHQYSDPSGWELKDGAGRGIPFDITTTFKITASPNGSTITSNNGPNVAWTDSLRSRSSICSNGWCWTYTQRAGSAANLSDMTWDRADSGGSGTPYKVCQSFAKSDDCGNTNLPNPPTEQPTEQPTEPPTNPTFARGDFNRDGAVNRTDYDALVAAIGTKNAAYDISDSADDMIDLYDYNAWLGEVD